MVDIVNFNADKSAFTVRPPRFRPFHIVLIGIFAAFAIITSIAYGSLLLGSAVIILTVAILATIVYLVQKEGFDDRTATEFQALVFSGALRSNTILSLIIHRDGSIFYLDPRYSLNFEKGAKNHNLDMFLNTIGLSNENKIQLLDAIRDMKKTEFEYVLHAQKRAVQLKISVCPIQRPEGFVVLNVTSKLG